ncbi:MAG: SpoIVB peptidase S55 domain-containing protein [Acidobacteriota bacterium]|nr:SpoIVB peptidase S55 domain-containing protein [Acidobacteriota bacterium]
MTLRSPHFLVLMLAGGFLASLPAQTVMMPVDRVRPGMHGIGVTVFAGTERTEFSAEILGILQNSIGPRRHLILARLKGGPLADSGVIQGMSGSPVYIENQLIGAVSYSMGSFPKDTIAGITPIGEMLRDDTASLAQSAPPILQLTLPLSTDTLTALLPNQLPRATPFGASLGDLRALGLPPAALASQLRPITTPLVVTGFTPEALNYLAPMFRAAGMVSVPGGALSRQTPPALLEPGDPIGVGLIQGDLSMAGTGTVTHVDGRRVYAFGHQFYNLGPSQFPMTRAYVHTILPSQAISSRITSIGETLGTIDQDRSTGISGSFGPGPPLVPVYVELHSPGRNRVDSFNFSVVSDNVFTPFLSYNAILNTLLSQTRQVGASSYSVQGRVQLSGLPVVTFQESFTGASAPLLAALYVSGPLTALLTNGFEPVTVKRVDVSITAHDDIRTAALERVWLDDPRPRPGRPLPLRVATRTHRGDEVIRTVMIDLPPSSTGRLQLLVADGVTLAQQERQQAGRAATATNLSQLVDAINDARRNNHLYIQLLRTDAGAVVNGHRLPSLPPSVLGVLSDDQRAGSFAPLRTAILREWNLSFDHVVSGSRRLMIDLDAY